MTWCNHPTDDRDERILAVVKRALDGEISEAEFVAESDRLTRAGGELSFRAYYLILSEIAALKAK